MSKRIYIGSTEIAGSDGKSAYQSWLDQGNIGTEAQFVASLKGADGKDGKDGAQGNTGSSVDYPYELVNNVTTDDATKGLSAAQGKVLDEKISQLGLESVNGLDGKYSTHYKWCMTQWSTGNFAASGSSYDGYVIPNIGYTKISATLGHNTNTVCAVAFYSTDNPIASGYMQSYSLRAGSTRTDYTTDIPAGCKCIVVSNRNTVQDSPTITLTMKSTAFEDSQKSPLYAINGVTAKFTTIETGYIGYNTGLRGSSNNFKRYIFRATGIESIKATLQSASNGEAAIAFYNDTEISTESYISGESIKIIGTLTDYYAKVPAGCKLIAISNRSTSLPTPTITLFSTIPEDVKTTTDVEVPLFAGSAAPWVQDEVDLIVNKLRNLSQKNLITFAFNTDQHIDYDTAAQNNRAVRRGLNSISKVAEGFPLDLVVLGGDEAGYDGTTSSTLLGIADDVAQIIEAADGFECPVVAMAGNHDAYQNMGVEISDGKQEYNWKLKRNVVRRNLNWAGSASTNCWIDDPVAKVRYVFLDGYSVKNGAILRSYGASADTELVNNINSAFSDEKLRNSEWEVIIFSHNVVASAGGNTADPIGDTFWALIQSYVALGVNLVACVNGHAHKIVQGVKDDVLMICVSQAMMVLSDTPAISESFDGITYLNLYESSKETSYSVFAYDRTAHKIYDFHYGAGVDRVFNAAKGSRGIELDVLSGVVSSSATVEGGTITATNHNAVYSVTLDSTGAYSFPYLCPEHTWEITVTLPGGGTSTQNYNATVGTHILNITV